VEKGRKDMTEKELAEIEVKYSTRNINLWYDCIDTGCVFEDISKLIKEVKRLRGYAPHLEHVHYDKAQWDLLAERMRSGNFDSSAALRRIKELAGALRETHGVFESYEQMMSDTGFELLLLACEIDDQDWEKYDLEPSEIGT
jgi:phage terminase large subunit-like protein